MKRTENKTRQTNKGQKTMNKFEQLKQAIDRYEASPVEISNVMKAHKKATRWHRDGVVERPRNGELAVFVIQNWSW